MEFDGSDLIRRSGQDGRVSEAKHPMTLHCQQCNTVLGDSKSVCGEISCLDSVMCLSKFTSALDTGTWCRCIHLVWTIALWKCTFQDNTLRNKCYIALASHLHICKKVLIPNYCPLLVNASEVTYDVVVGDVLEPKLKGGMANWWANSSTILMDFFSSCSNSCVLPLEVMHFMDKKSFYLPPNVGNVSPNTSLFSPTASVTVWSAAAATRQWALLFTQLRHVWPQPAPSSSSTKQTSAGELQT